MSAPPAYGGEDNSLNRTPPRTPPSNPKHERWATKSRITPTRPGEETDSTAAEQQQDSTTPRSSRRSSRRQSENTTPQKFNRFAQRRQQQQQQQQEQIDHNTNNNTTDQHQQQPRTPTKTKGSSKKKRKSLKKSKKDDASSNKTGENDEEEKPEDDNLEERLDEAMDEQERILAEPQDDFSYNRIPRWSQALADLTLIHEPSLNRDAPFVSQGVLDELNRDVLAAQELHNEVINLPDQRLAHPDPEEFARACNAPYVTTIIKSRREIFVDANLQLKQRQLEEDRKNNAAKKKKEGEGGGGGDTDTNNTNNNNHNNTTMLEHQQAEQEIARLLAEQQRHRELAQESLTAADLAAEQAHQPASQSERLVKILTAARDAFVSETRPTGVVGRHGEDGLETSSLPDASEISRQAALHRAMMEDQFPCHSSSADGPYPAITSAAGLALRNFRNVPKVHAEFIVDATQDAKGDDTILMDPGSARALIRDAEFLHGAAHASFSVSSSKRKTGGDNNDSKNQQQQQQTNNNNNNFEGKRIISVSLGSMRIRDHPNCTREHYFAHALLDAYSQYKMLTSNLLSGLKSRKHYEIIAEQLERSLMRRQRLNAMASGGGGSSARSNNTNNNNINTTSSGGREASATSYEEDQLTLQLAAAKTKLGMAVEMEKQTLSTMWNSWKALREYWRTDVAAAVGRDQMNNTNNNNNDEEFQAEMIRTQTINRLNGNMNANSRKGSVRLAFSLSRRDDPEQTPYSSDENGNNILDFVPNVIVDDPISVPVALGNIARRAKEDKKNSNTNDKENKDNGNNHVGDVISESKITSDSVIVLKLYLKTSEVTGFTLVGTTSPKTLDSVFGVTFNETFELHVNREPQTMLIHACLVPTGKVIAQVAIPPSLTHAAHELPFTTGERFLSATDSMPHEVGGVIIASTTWTTNSGLTVESIERLFLNGDADPLDPRNAPLVAALRRHYQLRAATAATAADKIRGRPMISLLSQEQKDEVTSSSSGKPKLKADSILKDSHPLTDRRLQLLQLRWKILTNDIDDLDKIEPIERRVTKEAIPATAEATELMERHIRTLAEIEDTELRETKSVVAAGGADPKDTGRAWLLKLKDKKQKTKPPVISDAEKMKKLITLPSIPSPALLIQQIKNMFVPHSGFNPPRELREATIEDVDRTKINEKWGASTISCSVMKAANLPIREDGSPINAFVELRFVDKAVCTRPQPGITPSWFETLSVPFEPEDFEDDTLNFIDDDIVLSVYDEVRVHLPTNTTTNPNSMVTHFRVERRFLGAVKVPFYTLYSQKTASIEASFRVFQPRVSMGYVLSPVAMPTINLFIALNPPLRKTAPVEMPISELTQLLKESPSSQTLRRLNSTALTWTSQAEGAIRAASALSPTAAERDVLPFAPTSSRDRQLLCRFLRDDGINPPPGIESIPEAIRFVSLFRFEVDMVTAAEGDQWSTLSEFLAMKVGDYEELAILLVMLLRGLNPDLPIFLITGLGDVYPQAVYVLIYLNDAWKLIDPRTGDLYDTSSTLTGITEVSLIISHNQIWANIQPSGTPYQMMWNLDDVNHWMPMFDAEHRQLMSTIEPLQPTTIHWDEPASRKECADFEDVVRRQVKESLRNLRQDRNVVFHERIAVRMRDVLICMEDERRASANIPHPIVGEAMQRALSEFAMEYKVVGCPVNCSVRKCDDETLVEQLGPLKDAIRETAVHEVGAQGTCFAVAVHVRSYSCGIMSVWVYVVGLVQRA